MANPYYTKTGLPATLGSLSSAAIRDQFTLTEQGFDKLPALTADNIIFVNAGGTALEAKTAAAALTAMGAQPLDSGLTSIAGLTTAANKMIYTTALDTYAVTSITVAGRALIDDASASAQRDTLALGSSDAVTFTSLAVNSLNLGGVPVSLVSYNWGSVITVSADLTSGAGHMVNTAGGDVTMNLPSSISVGDVFGVHHIDSTDAGNTCRVAENGNTITYKGVDQAADITIARGETIYLVATATNTVEIA